MAARSNGKIFHRKRVCPVYVVGDQKMALSWIKKKGATRGAVFLKVVRRIKSGSRGVGSG